MELKRFKGIWIFVVLLCFTQMTYSTDFSGGVMFGYNGGTGFQLNSTVSNFAQGFPFKMQFGVGYSRVDPGSPLGARKVFINDATNGDPEEAGHFWDFRLDLLYRVHWLGLREAFVYGGPRYSMFDANFNFVGGNETFDIGSDQWGWGLGFTSYFPMGKKIDLAVTTGADYFLSSKIGGHDTFYSPDGEDVNARNDFKYKDADEVINQPKLELRLMLGLNYHF